MHNTQFGPFLGTNRSPDGSVRILLPIAGGSKRPQAVRGDPDQEAASWLEKSSEGERGGSLRFATKIHSTGGERTRRWRRRHARVRSRQRAETCIR
jgi:hypothetical protein